MGMHLRVLAAVVLLLSNTTTGARDLTWGLQVGESWPDGKNQTEAAGQVWDVINVRGHCSVQMISICKSYHPFKTCQHFAC